MLNNQKLYDRTMVVKMDRANSRDKGAGGDLPSGLSGIGPSIETKDPLPSGLYTDFFFNLVTPDQRTFKFCYRQIRQDSPKQKQG